MMTQRTIRMGLLEDLPELQRLFLDTVTEICKPDYDNDQIKAWTSDTKNKKNQKRWLKILTKQIVLIAQQDDKIVGFGTLDKGHYIDFLYVHRNYQRQGIAASLYKSIENEARRQKQTGLTADVSKTARPFFEKVGFEVTKEKTVVRQGVRLTNYKMEKDIE